MINAADLAALFEEIIGWPYVSPGTNDRNGIDCSGAFVRAYRKYGLSIAHGSNTIYRQHCDVVGPIGGDTSRLRVGMAVFKQRLDGGEPDKFKGDGCGNVYHIGLVTSTSPLRIVHATTPSAKADTAIGQWSHYGRLREVDYSAGIGAGDKGNISNNTAGSNVPGAGGDQSVTIPEIPVATENISTTPSAINPSRYFAFVRTPDGKPVKMRAEPKKACGLYIDVPFGEIVTVIGQVASGGATWARVERNSRKWYIMTDYLSRADG